ncbi:polysaccharide export protein [Coraliomargarita sp. SDUM461004]|uniref:Polysaccharide export protein n=1 Tax=Thalassobacterium sedimentorum TaxID=3041258 RepID=A0ABU1AMI0_9BACT|nr:polysaccharide biosynthesis/export family protein [Coraliomargarita sp. SDUM461004]MDQ8195944.1 polysaccharide export protein [Coraliomargarita sp. SDUM461004]
MRHLLISLFALLFLFAAELMATDAMPAPSLDAAKYLLSPFDRVSISVYGEPELQSEQRVSDEGTLSIPLLGEIAVGNLSVSKAQKVIETAFIEERYLVRPVVTINIVEFAPKVVTVVGEVARPGSIEIPPGRNGLAIQVAIAEAGGFTGAAQKGQVSVERKGADGSKTTFEVDVNAIFKAEGKNAEEVFVVLPDDIIFIPRRLF